MIDILSGVLHYALNNREWYVPVKEEIENTKKYIEIQQMRFDYRFSVEWEAAGNLENLYCLKFVLQPLVENSLSHGLKGGSGGRIRIAIKQEEESLTFSVADNGHGFKSERLVEINESFSRETVPEKNTGLYNLNKRLILSCGPAAALVIRSGSGEETVVTFTIPLNRGGDSLSLTGEE
jgi:two-component system sensor histidine kinase YesM